ncbi:hypothetical protein JCM15519_04240 [Fundidesulfovibrio butyratiphilus]
MAKEQLHGLEAERLYVIEQCPLSDIADRLGVSARTLQTWKAKGDWDAKRRAYLGSRQSFHEELYEFGREMLASIRRDLAAGQEIPPGRLYALMRLLPNLVRVQDYEQAAKVTPEKAAPITPEELAAIIDRQLCGNV